MAILYSDNLATTLEGPYNPSFRRDATKTHARLRRKRMQADLPVTSTDDVVIMGKFKSNDRLYDLLFSTASGAPGAGAVHIGLHESGLEHDASVEIDEDLFATAVDLLAQADYEDVFTEAALDEEDRGKKLWELAGYTADPQIDFDLTMTFSTGADATETYVLEARYIAFG